ncbi:MAG: DUF302 domain-containing protein [Pseudomonadota bacterium]|nr:DUF302 domain-containing protein [Pseudomonadota bacterium]
MIHHIRSLFLLLALLCGGVATAAEPAPKSIPKPIPEPMILTATAQGRDMEAALAALNQAIVNHNYTFVRQQAIDNRLVPYAQEVRSVRLVYFCNFAKMDRALRLDLRAAQMLPCRVTLIETPTGVDLIAVNPAWVSQNMPGLHEECQELKNDYLAILEEASL